MKKMLSATALLLALSTFATVVVSAQSASTTNTNQGNHTTTTNTIIQTSNTVSAIKSPLALNEQTYFHEAPGGKLLGWLQPQDVPVHTATTDSSNATWYRVHTWIGEAWIKDPNAHIKTAVVASNTYYFAAPNGKALGSLSKQSVKVLSESTDNKGAIWYKINTSHGKAWIKSPVQPNLTK
ncbi:hypothetical protein [Paenibacillus sp. 481]|uniref:hypothetical protein n=1 Tax=Paenibacillus sp. 481 TaxID=2835869 RepID=UPI001E29322B|nr:hypothetical protein [Paenibacillus sp. 481]UHA74782.1 hypothetical protein KIK04_06905 [Paenibacillus sp. 481]